MQRVIQIFIQILGFVSPVIGARFAYYLFFKPFRLKSHPLDLEKKKSGTQLDFVIQGKKTSAWYWGEGPVVILVHGWSSKGFHYRKFIDPMVDAGFTVVIPDLPGHVRSEGASSNVLEFKETLEAISLHFTNVYGLVGHSLGAMACILMLADNKVAVEKLVVANSAIYADSIMTRFMEQIKGNARIKKALVKRLSRIFNQDFNYYSTVDRIHDIQVKPEILVIGDENDKEVSVNEAKELADVTKSELLITKQLGHNGGLKDDQVIKTITEFLVKKNRDKPG